MRGKGKGHRFDYLFKKLNTLNDKLSFETNKDNLLNGAELKNEALMLKEEILKKEVYSIYEEYDKDNLLNGVEWLLEQIK